MVATQLIMFSPNMSFEYMSQVVSLNNDYQGMGSFFQQSIDDELIINFVNQDLEFNVRVTFTFWSTSQDKANQFLARLQDRSITTSPTVIFEKTGDFTIEFAQPNLNFDDNSIDFDIGTTLVANFLPNGSMTIFNEIFEPEQS